MNPYQQVFFGTSASGHLRAAFVGLVMALVLLPQAGAATADGESLDIPSPKPAPHPVPPQVVIQTDPASLGYTLAPGIRKVKKRLLLKGYDFHFPFSGLIWMDDHRFIVNIDADSNGNYHFARGSKRQSRIAVVDIDTGEITYTPYEGIVACYNEGRIAIIKNVFSDAPPYEKKGWEEVYGQFGEMLRTPVPKPIPGGFKVGDPYLNLSTCRIEPLPTKIYPINFGGASLSTEYETVIRVKDSDVDMGSFKNNAFVQNMGVVQKTKTLWHGPNGEVKEIKTNIGEFYSYRDSAYVPFERGAYYFASVFGDTLQPDLLFLPKFNRLIYPDGTVVRFGVPDLIWDNYFLNLGLPGVGSTYTKAGIVWHINSGRPGKNKLLEAGDYLEDKAKKQLIKIDTAFWSRGLAPDGCRLVNPEEGTIQGSGTDSYRLYNIYIYDICTGE